MPMRTTTCTLVHEEEEAISGAVLARAFLKVKEIAKD